MWNRNKSVFFKRISFASFFYLQIIKMFIKILFIFFMFFTKFSNLYSDYEKNYFQLIDKFLVL